MGTKFQGMKNYRLACATALALLLCLSAQAQRWRAIIERPRENDRDVSFCNTFNNGAVRVSPSGRDYRTRFELRDTFFVDNNFTLEVRIRNGLANGGISAFDPGVYLEGCNINAGVSLMGDAWAQSFTSMYAHTAGIGNQPQFVQNFNDWRVVRLVFQNNTFRVFYENNLLYTLPYTGDLTFLHKVTVRFKGSGLLDWLRLYTGNGQLLWQEEFTNCNNMTPAPNWRSALNLQTTTDTLVCAGEPLGLTAALLPGATYQWTGPNGFNSNEQNPLLNAVTARDTGLYTVVATYRNCTSLRKSLRVGLRAPDVPAAHFLGNDTTLCPGDSLRLGQLYTCATYQWQDGSTNATQLVNKNGLYSLTITIDNQTFTDSIQINYQPQPQVFLGNDTTLCPGSSLNLQMTHPTARAYRWQDGSTSPDFTVQTPGTYTLVVTDVCNNVATDTLQVAYFNRLQPLNLGRDTTFCTREPLILNVFDSAAVQYCWQDGSTQPSFVANVSGIYQVTLTDACGNTQTDSLELRYATPLQSVHLGRDTTLCPGQRLQLDVADSRAARYRWQDGSTGATFDVQQPGIYTVAVEDYCNNTLRDTVQVGYYKTLKILDLGADTTLCPGQALLLNAQDSAATAYRWQDGSVRPTFLVNQAGIYSVAIEDYCGNIATDSIEIQYFSLASPVNLGPDTTLCTGNTIRLRATDSAARFYRWQNGSTDSILLVRQPGVYTVQVTDFCGNTQRDTVEIDYFPVLKKLDLGRDTALCPGTAIQLNVADAAAQSYRWQDGSSQADFTINTPGVYTVEVQDYCKNIVKDSIQVTYYQLLSSIDLGPRDTSLCLGETVLLDAGSQADAQFLWQDGTRTATYLVTQPGIYQVQASDFCGNSATEEIRVRYTGLPQADRFAGDTIVCETQTFVLNATAPNATFYRWQDGSTKSTYPVTQPGIYEVTVGNECGDTTYTVAIGMQYCGPCRTYVPNAFSPNGDGNNDEFDIGTECIFTHYQLRIFDRWGVLVFGANAPWNRWNGTFNGKALPSGVYVWQLRYKAEDGSEQTLSGDVFLMK